MAQAFRAQAQQVGITDLSFEGRFALLVMSSGMERQNRALDRRLAKAKWRHRVSVEDIDFRSPRGLDRTLVRSLSQDSACVLSIRTFFGPIGIGKSFLACALAEKACRDGFTAFYSLPSQRFAIWRWPVPMAVCARCSPGWARLDVLVVDDWAMGNHAPVILVAGNHGKELDGDMSLPTLAQVRSRSYLELNQ